MKKSQSPYEPKSLPGMEYQPKGYEPQGLKDLKTYKDLSDKIHEKQSKFR